MQSTNTAAPAPWGALPTERQLAWHELEYYGFVHFTVNTFTNREWGLGNEDPSIFNPTELDARQWARVARDAGMRGLVLTAKHHDGFCLWPSAYTEHSVKNCPWKGGKGDVVKELSEACKEFGIKFGIYLSPWDRNHAEYGTPAYIEYYKKQLLELLTGYGELFEMWFDGANGGTGYYGGANEERQVDRKSYYNFPDLWETVRKYQPSAIMFSDAGPDIRWIGNEAGHAPETCWAKINPEGIYVGEADVKRLAHGDGDGSVWRPAEVDVSVRKGWFYHPEEEPKSPQQLLDIYGASVGRGCGLILNITPDRRGLIPDKDIENLLAFKGALDRMFAVNLAAGAKVSVPRFRGNDPRFGPENVVDGDPQTYFATDDDAADAEITLDLGEPKQFNLLRIKEPIRLGQRIEGFSVDAFVNGSWTELASGNTIGARRILPLPATVSDKVRVRITKSLACPLISSVELFDAAGK